VANFYNSRKWMIKIGKLKKIPKFYNSKRWRGFGDLSGNTFCQIKYSAVRRGIPFRITIQNAWEQFLKQDGRCALTGIKLKILSLARNKKNTTASLDRKNSKYGYTRNNIQWTIKKINVMKGTMNNNTFKRWCVKVAQFINM